VRAVQDHEAIDDLRVQCGESPGHAAAPVVADDVGPLRAERRYERRDVVGEDRCAIRGDALRLLALAVAPEVGRDNLETLGELGDLLAPGARGFGKAVEQDDERALSLQNAVEPDAVDGDVALHPAMLACPMPGVLPCLLTSPSASGCSPDGSLWSSG